LSLPDPAGSIGNEYLQELACIMKVIIDV